MKQMSNEDYRLTVDVLEQFTRGEPPSDLRAFNLHRRAKKLLKRLKRKSDER